MADFCRECTAEMFGEDYVDRNDMLRPEMSDHEMAVSLCESCGIQQFDRNGLRVSEIPDDYTFDEDGEPNYLWSASQQTWLPCVRLPGLGMPVVLNESIPPGTIEIR